MIHKNIPATLAKITTIVSAEGLNVENLANKSRKEYAYTMLDINGPISEEAIAQLGEIEGMIRIRVI
jgi:D-3-phosphoglycerate dehydrogenase